MTDLVFSSQFKQKIRRLGAVLLLAAGTGPFAVGLIVITYLLPPTGVATAVTTTAAFGLGLLLPWASQNWLALLGNTYLRRRLAEKVADLGYQPEQMDFVGFSPGGELRIWEGETDRDVGFLAIREGVLVYQGDGVAWRLRKDSIDALRLFALPGVPQRITISWHAPREPSRGLTLASRTADTIKRCNAATRELFERLKQWYDSPSMEGSPPPLGQPPTSLSGSSSADKPPAGSCVSVLAIGLIVTLSIWHIAKQLIASEYYYHGMLWSGLIMVGAMILTSHFLTYLQTFEARDSSRSTGS